MGYQERKPQPFKRKIVLTWVFLVTQDIKGVLLEVNVLISAKKEILKKEDQGRHKAWPNTSTLSPWTRGQYEISSYEIRNWKLFMAFRSCSKESSYFGCYLQCI